MPRIKLLEPSNSPDDVQDLNNNNSTEDLFKLAEEVSKQKIAAAPSLSKEMGITGIIEPSEDEQKEVDVRMSKEVQKEKDVERREDAGQIEMDESPIPAGQQLPQETEFGTEEMLTTDQSATEGLVKLVKQVEDSIAEARSIRESNPKRQTGNMKPRVLNTPLGIDILATAAYYMVTRKRPGEVFKWTTERASTLSAERVDTIISLLDILRWKAAQFTEDFLEAGATDACFIGILNRASKECPEPVEPNRQRTATGNRFPDLADQPPSPSVWSQTTEPEPVEDRTVPAKKTGRFSPGPAITPEDKIIAESTMRKLKAEEVVKQTARKYHLTEDYVCGLIEAAKRQNCQSKQLLRQNSHQLTSRMRSCQTDVQAVTQLRLAGSQPQIGSQYGSLPTARSTNGKRRDRRTVVGQMSVADRPMTVNRHMTPSIVSRVMPETTVEQETSGHVVETTTGQYTDHLGATPVISPVTIAQDPGASNQLDEATSRTDQAMAGRREVARPVGVARLTNAATAGRLRRRRVHPPRTWPETLAWTALPKRSRPLPPPFRTLSSHVEPDPSVGSPTFVVASIRRRYEQLRLRASRQRTEHSHEHFRKSFSIWTL